MICPRGLRFSQALRPESTMARSTKNCYGFGGELGTAARFTQAGPVGMAMLTANVLGGFRLCDAEGRDITPRSRKARALLGFLTLSGSGQERREKLAGLLWSESSIEQAYDSLRHCLSELRAVERRTGLGFLVADRQIVALDRRRLGSDLGRLRAALGGGDVAACRPLFGGADLTLLAGQEIDDPAFDNWLMVERERVAAALSQEMLAALRAPGLAAPLRLELVRAIERLDPYQEEAVGTHMRLLAAEGNLAGAMACYDGYRGRLAREYEVEPSEELQELADSLQAQPPRGNGRARNGAEPVPGLPVEPEAERPSAEGRTPRIAVLRLPKSAAGGRIEQLTEAFCHELISTLCRFKEWAVVASSGAPAVFDDAAPDPLAGLASLEVDYALLASVFDVAGSTAINIRLMDCVNRSVLISDQYPASSENWPAVFNDICCRVATRMQVSIAASRLRSVAGRSLEQRKAYDIWLEGEVLQRMWTPETEHQAVQLFQRALTLDDQLACAYGSLASILNTRWIIFPGCEDDAASRQQAYDLAKRAVALDPLDCRNHMHLGWSHLLAGRFEPGELHFQLAYDLNPSNPDNLIVCGLAFAFCGKHARARELCDRAFELNPLRPAFYWGYRATIALLGRDFADCIEAVAMVPDIFPDIQGWAAVAYAYLGRLEQAGPAREQLFADIRTHWAGSKPLRDDEIEVWFTTVFPIKQPEDRQLLTDGLARIPWRGSLRERRPRHGGGQAG